MSNFNSNSFVISLFEIGEFNSCLFSWFCFPCALSQSRTFLDNSSCLFNYFCLSPTSIRWLIRSNYEIEGDSCNDCLISSFCPCCSANQLYQTTKRYGQISNDGGLSNNTGTWINQYGSGTLQDFLYSCCCIPCATGKVLERSIGMPWFMGCLCTSPCAARNLIRYQYRIAGNDLIEECAIPYGLKLFADITQSCFPFVWLFVYGIFAVGTMQQLKEVESRSALGLSSQRYLSRNSSIEVGPVSVINSQNNIIVCDNNNNNINNNNYNPNTFISSHQIQLFQPRSSGYNRIDTNNPINPVVAIPVHEKL